MMWKVYGFHPFFSLGLVLGDRGSRRNFGIMDVQREGCAIRGREEDEFEREL